MIVNEGERRAFLGRYFRELEDWRERDLRMSYDGGGPGKDMERFERQSRRLARWRQAYQNSLSTVVMARCPFSGELFRHSFDGFGLDGLWWNFEAPVRPYEELLPSYFAFTGAVSLAEPLESSPFLCKPGPGVPYVLPELLEHPDIEAVIRELPVGPHRAFAVIYFARSTPSEVTLPNEWGTDRAYVQSGESVGWVSQVEDPSKYDFDLKPWLERNKLHWICRDDPGVELSAEADECPYVDLPGERRLQRIENGKVWME